MGSEVLIESTTYLKASVIDLDLTFFIQMAVFLILYILLSNFFFKPYTKYLSRRDDSTAGLKTRGREMDARANSLEKSMERRLEEARQAGIAERVKAVTEAAALRDRLVAQQRAQLQEKVDREIANLDVAKQNFLKAAGPAVIEIADAIERQLDAVEGGR